MLTDTARRPAPAARFLLRFVAWLLGLFGLLRFGWVELHIVWPFTRFQASAAAIILGAPRLPVETTLACSGADALALCLGAILAYPGRWRVRLAGAAGALALIAALNIVRIATLGRAAASLEWFNALHLYIWPLLLTLAIAGYVVAWTRIAERPSPSATGEAPQPAAPASTRTRIFVALTAVFMVIFIAIAPLYLDNRAVRAVAGFIARAAGVLLRSIGIHAVASANILVTDRGALMVTEECITTPLIPVYLAWVCAFSTNWRRFAIGALAALPLFIALGVARLLVVALPASLVSSPIVLVHAFYQLLLGAVVVLLLAWRRHGRAAAVPAVSGIAAGAAFIWILGAWYTRAIAWPVALPVDDPQSAVALLPGFQIGLYLALWIAARASGAWPRCLAGLAVLALLQIAGLAAVHLLASHWGVSPHVRDIRAWAVAAPLFTFMLLHGRRQAGHGTGMSNSTARTAGR